MVLIKCIGFYLISMNCVFLHVKVSTPQKVRWGLKYFFGKITANCLNFRHIEISRCRHEAAAKKVLFQKMHTKTLLAQHFWRISIGYNFLF